MILITIFNTPCLYHAASRTVKSFVKQKAVPDIPERPDRT